LDSRGATAPPSRDVAAAVDSLHALESLRAGKFHRLEQWGVLARED
jgi:hypothetical protein